MKIGILTFYRAPNFGAMLQAYALEQYLVARGHTVRFIEDAVLYERRPSLLSVICSRSLRGVRIKWTRWMSYRKTRFAARFARLLPGEKPDMYLVGSDQVWNPKWYGTPEFVEKMFLGNREKTVRRIAYAASFGADEWTAPSTAGRVGELLRNFDKISVREPSGVEIVKGLSGRTDVSCLMDPTLLNPASFYWSLIGGKRSPGNAAFVYLLNWSDTHAADCVLASAREQGMRLVKRASAGMLVEDWLREVATACLVVTNSFHGTAFAILFHRPFVTLKLSGEAVGMNERVSALLTSVGLENRFVSEHDQTSIRMALSSTVDWELVDERLEARRRETDVFFAEAGI